MNWIDDDLALGGWSDTSNDGALEAVDIDLVIDVRPLFHEGTFDVGIVLAAVDQIIAASDEHRILLHCTWGRDRSPFIAMLYLARKYGLSYEEAYHEVKAARPLTAYHWDWVFVVENEDELT
jgi:protein-tyrosine phosphatase